jgi:hypothetical protein
MARSIELQRYRRHLSKRSKGGGLWCVLCSEPAQRGTGVEWLDLAFPARGSVFFVLCLSCANTPYTEALNRLHRETWRIRHADKTQVPAQ